LIGPIFVKIAIEKSGEAGLDISIDDLIAKTKVKEIMNRDIPLIKETMDLKRILKIFSENNNINYPVVDNSNKLIGIITIETIKEVFLESELESILLAHDIMEPLICTVKEDFTVDDVRNKMEKYLVDFMPVVNDKNEVIGFVESRQIKRLVSNKILAMKKKLESLE